MIDFSVLISSFIGTFIAVAVCMIPLIYYLREKLGNITLADLMGLSDRD